MVGTLGIAFLGPIVVELALKLGPAEYFSLMVLCFVTVSAVLGGCSLRGGEGSIMGIALGTVLLQVLQNLVNLTQAATENETDGADSGT